MGSIIFFVVLMIVGALIKKATSRSSSRNSTNPRVQRLIERVQAQQGGSQPTQFQGQYTQPASGQGTPAQPPVLLTYPDQSGRAPSSAQVSAVLQQLLQAGRQPARLGQPSPTQYSGPAQGQSGPAPGFAGPGFGGPGFAGQGQYAPPGQFQPSQPSTWLPSYQPPAYQPAHRPPQNNLPNPKGDTDTRVRELMANHHEVAAVRLLCDEQDMGIIEAQKYARSLVTPPGPAPRSTSESSTPTRDSQDRPVEETRYVGSAAFAESVFDTDADENVWASGWVDKPEPEDRSDMEELWQTVRDGGRPKPS